MKTIMHICSDSIVGKSRLNYFKTIKEALDAVKTRNADEVELHLHKGIYTCNIKVDKPLSIVGEKGKQSDILLKGFIDNSNGKKLEIKNITIDNSINYGIKQIGGTLDMQNVVITRATYRRKRMGKFIHDACISLSRGAILKAKNLIMFRNTLTTILVDGENSKAVLSNTVISDNKISKFYIQNPPLLIGVIEVTNKGTICIENCIIENNEYISISVHDNGKMHLRDSTVKGTKQVQNESGNLLFGDNIHIASGGTVELHRFFSSDAQRVGLMVDQGYLTAEDGTINNNSIGICFFSNPVNDPNYNPYNCIYDNVLFINNGTTNGSLYVALPDIDLDGSSSIDRSLCKVVPWV
jgi:hypothetical protein